MNSRRGAGPGRPPARASPRGRACHPSSRGPGPAASSPGTGRPGGGGGAAAAGRASRSWAGARRLAGRDALTRRRLQWRRRQGQRRRRQRQRQRQRRGPGGATSASAGQAGRSTGSHAPRLRAAPRRDGSRALVPVLRGGMGQAQSVTWACPGALQAQPRRCEEEQPANASIHRKPLSAGCSPLYPTPRPKRPANNPRRGAQALRLAVLALGSGLLRLPPSPHPGHLAGLPTPVALLQHGFWMGLFFSSSGICNIFPRPRSAEGERPGMLALPPSGGPECP
ncbi:CLK4-associating serine/arginine rich protein-like [Bos taurus]|uniref:CLK4-associating serine/arginine rich protein-like n=1 Tax=Bos taurus TaxID=9913 RepID=UPI000D536677|nr:CLK4-associating serine/arginine rich protein-like [Bos taurus]